MPNVIVQDGEPLKAALQRLRKEVNIAYRRQFYKTRVGCYEKPSDRARRARRAKSRRIELCQNYGPDSYTVYIGLRGLHSRGEDPFSS